MVPAQGSKFPEADRSPFFLKSYCARYFYLMAHEEERFTCPACYEPYALEFQRTPRRLERVLRRRCTLWKKYLAILKRGYHTPHLKLCDFRALREGGFLLPTIRVSPPGHIQVLRRGVLRGVHSGDGRGRRNLLRRLLCVGRKSASNVSLLLIFEAWSRRVSRVETSLERVFSKTYIESFCGPLTRLACVV